MEGKLPNRVTRAQQCAFDMFVVLILKALHLFQAAPLAQRSHQLQEPREDEADVRRREPIV